MNKFIPTQTLLNKKILTYQEILNLKSRMNGYRALKSRQDGLDANSYQWRDEYDITPDHTRKGYDWLIERAFKPSLLQELFTKWDDTEGNCVLEPFTRKNSPLAYRELSIILDFDHFTFIGFYDDSTYGATQMGYRNYLPIWRCYDKEGNSFDYYVGSLDNQPVIIG